MTIDVITGSATQAFRKSSKSTPVQSTTNSTSVQNPYKKLDSWSSFSKTANDLSGKKPIQGLTDRRPGFENESGLKNFIRNAIQAPKSFLTRWLPLIQVWASAESSQAIDESLEAVEKALQQGLIDQEKADALSNEIKQSASYTVPDQRAIEQSLEQSTGIPLQSSSRLGDLLGLGGSTYGFGGKGVSGVLRGVGAGLLSRGFENTGLAPEYSDPLAQILSLLPIPKQNGLIPPDPIRDRSRLLGKEIINVPGSIRDAITPEIQSVAKNFIPQIEAISSELDPGEKVLQNISQGIQSLRKPTYDPYTSMGPNQIGSLINQTLPPPPQLPSPTIYLPDSVVPPSAELPISPKLSEVPEVTPAQVQEIPEIPEEKPSTPEIILQDQVGSVVSPSKFKNSTSGGKQLKQLFTKDSNTAYQQVNKLYQKSKALNKNIEDIRPQLSADLQRVANQLTEAPVPATIEKDILQIIRSIQKEIGNEELGYQLISNQALIDQIQSINRKNQTELILGNAKNIYRVLINAIEKELERSAAQFPEALNALQEARNARRQWGEIYDNDVVYPLKDPANKNYSQTFNALLKPDSINILQQAIGNTKGGQQYINRLKRAYTEQTLTPFSKGRSINTIDYQNAIRELEPVIGKEGVDSINRIFTTEAKQKAASKREISRAKKKKEAIEERNKAEIAREKAETKERNDILAANNKAMKKYQTEVNLIQQQQKKWPEHVKEAQRLNEASIKKYQDELRKLDLYAEYRNMTPEQIYNSSNTITGLKKLKKALKSHPDLYRDISYQKAYDLLTGNKYGRPSLQDINTFANALQDSKKREVLNFILGEKKASNLEKIVTNTEKITQLITREKPPKFPIISSIQILTYIKRGMWDLPKNLYKTSKANYLRNTKNVKTIEDLPELLKDDDLLQKAADAISSS